MFAKKSKERLLALGIIKLHFRVSGNATDEGVNDRLFLFLEVDVFSLATLEDLSVGGFGIALVDDGFSV